MSSITLIQQKPTSKKYYAVIKEFEDAFNCPKVPENPLPFPLKLIYRLSSPIIKQIPTEKIYFAILMGVPHIYKVFPYFSYKARAKGLYIFDCWEYQYQSLLTYIQKYKITHIFTPSKQNVLDLKDLLPSFCKIFWLPEAINPQSGYHSGKKTIDVIQFGRRYEPYHQILAKSDLNYFADYIPSHEEFLQKLGSAKISICFPSKLTHPERSGNIAYMTARYVQSMASKCLIVGTMPDEMRELFPYQPIIEADFQDPVGQLKEILNNFDKYQDLIEKNYREVLANHTWQERIKKINNLLIPGQ